MSPPLKEEGPPFVGGPYVLRLRSMSLWATVVAAVDLIVVLLRFINRLLRSTKVTQVLTIFFIREPTASRTMNFMIAIVLGIFVYIESHQYVLLSR
jgi:hypothetical protein